MSPAARHAAALIRHANHSLLLALACNAGATGAGLLFAWSPAIGATVSTLIR